MRKVLLLLFILATSVSVWSQDKVILTQEDVNDQFESVDTIKILSDITNIDNANIYPNPCKNVLNIDNMNNISELQISNMIGQTVYRIENPGQFMKIDLSEYKSGLYFVSLADNNKNIKTQRIIKN